MFTNIKGDRRLTCDLQHTITCSTGILKWSYFESCGYGIYGGVMVVVGGGG